MNETSGDKGKSNYSIKNFLKDFFSLLLLMEKTMLWGNMPLMHSLLKFKYVFLLGD